MSEVLIPLTKVSETSDTPLEGLKVQERAKPKWWLSIAFFILSFGWMAFMVWIHTIPSKTPDGVFAEIIGWIVFGVLVFITVGYGLQSANSRFVFIRIC